MNRFRCFLGLNFSVGVTRKIAEEIERQRKLLAEKPGLKLAWVPPANLHLTLRFLGSIDEDLVDGLMVRLKRIAARNPPFEARARGLGAFPDAERPKVLWVGVEGDGVVKLQKDVEATVIELGFAKEDRAFHPHVTVARVREAAPLGEWASTVEMGASTINEIVVYESRTSRSTNLAGVEYVARARIALGKGD
jgi:RNA 2',3'-cyclic 3'-phosphodiesterase